jgi:hypothetical protein
VISRGGHDSAFHASMASAASTVNFRPTKPSMSTTSERPIHRARTWIHPLRLPFQSDLDVKSLLAITATSKEPATGRSPIDSHEEVTKWLDHQHGRGICCVKRLSKCSPTLPR